MPKRKKYTKLPNGFGSIKYLGKGRRNAYGVYPPCSGFTLDGIPVTQKALCYVDNWMKGFAVLTAYKAGTYVPGMESEMTVEKIDSTGVQALTQRILADYNRMRGLSAEKPEEKSFAEVYEAFYIYKFETDHSRTYSQSARNSTKAAYKNCSSIHDRIFTSLRHPDLQAVIDNCPLKHASLELIVSLLHQMYEYAIIYEIVDKDYSSALKINKADDDEHGEPFTEDELKVLWKNKKDPVVEMLLIMCYSGYRIKAYENLEVNLKEKYFKGGVKTTAGKDRVVPIHSGILELVRHRLKGRRTLLDVTPGTFRKKMFRCLDELGITRHTPHDCRHTFSALCEKHGVNENDRKRMLGHSFGTDITNQVYGHRTIEDLRSEIEKIKICC